MPTVISMAYTVCEFSRKENAHPKPKGKRMGVYYQK